MGARLDRAWLLYERSRYDMAEKEIGLALAQDPDDPSAHGLMAMCLLERERFDEATEHAKRAVGGAPNEPFAHYVLARVWAARNYLDNAETAVREALRLDPDTPDYHTFLGILQMRRSDWRSAQAAAEEALAIDPEHVEAVNLRAQALRRQGRKESAEEELAEALRMQPEDAWTHANLGWNHLEQGNRIKAMEHFREALRLEPELESAREGVLETLKSQNVAYRLLLRYFFWMSNFGQRGQWAVVLGAWLAFNLTWVIADAHPALAPWLTPLIVAYLVFALATWLAVPLGNVALRLHPFGRLALSRDERIASNWVGGFLLAAIVGGIAFWITGTWFTKGLLVFFGFMLVPVGATFRCASPWPRKALVIYTLVVGAFGLTQFGLRMMAILGDPRTWSPAFGALWLTAFKTTTQVFIWGAVLSMWVGNIVLSIRWRK